MGIEPNPYTSLGLMPGSSLAEIKRRYRQLAKQYHPDRNEDSAASEAKLRDLNAAYEFLSDTSRKAAYDARFEDVFSPTHLAQPKFPVRPTANYVSPALRQRHRSFWPTVGLTLLVLASTGAGILLSSDNASSSLAGMLPQLPKTTSVGTDPTPQDYSFLPSNSPFASQSSLDSSPQSSQP